MNFHPSSHSLTSGSIIGDSFIFSLTLLNRTHTKYAVILIILLLDRMIINRSD